MSAFEPTIQDLLQIKLPILLNGIMSRDENFFEGLNNLISNFCVRADGFQGLSTTYQYPTKIINFLFASLKLHLILKPLLKPSSEFSPLCLVDGL
jgi:hypothetical protein